MRSSASLATATSPTSRLRRFAAVVGLAEALMYATLAPLLPGLSADLGLSRVEVGTLVAAFPAGLVLATYPIGIAASRFSPRRVTTSGLAMLAVGSMSFAVVDSVGALLAARFIQGVGSAAAWTGALTWIATSTVSPHRSQAMSVAISAAFCGSLCGPLLGALAAEAGRPTTFGGLALVLALLALWGGPPATTPTTLPAAPSSTVRKSPLRIPALAAILAVFIALGVVSGTVVALGPLVLAAGGISPTGIAMCFVAAAAPQILITTSVGQRLSGRNLPRVGFGLMVSHAVLVSTLAASAQGFWAAVLFAAALGTGYLAINRLYVLIASTCDEVGASQGLTMSLANGSWGMGAVTGAIGLTQLADEWSVNAAFAIAGIIALTSGALLGPMLRRDGDRSNASRRRRERHA